MNNPTHIAVIMDGNGRWASARGLPRSAGHKKGVDATRAIVRHAGQIGLRYLTLFAFSVDNWVRPPDEISGLVGLLRLYLQSEANDLIKNNVCLRVIGNRDPDRFPEDILAMISQLEDVTADNTGLNLIIALDYGSRQEIMEAALATAYAVFDRDKEPDRQEIEDMFKANLMTCCIPDPDLIIRTSGEKRLSNFLLWQAAYSEFIFSDKLWPDYTPADFDDAIAEFQKRERRYGGTGAQSDKQRKKGVESA